MSKYPKYLIHKTGTLETEDLWELVFDEKNGAWCVDHYWSYRETRSRGSRRRSVAEFEATAAGKRLADELRETLRKAEQDAKGT